MDISIDCFDNSYILYEKVESKNDKIWISDDILIKKKLDFFKPELSEENFWQTVIEFQNYKFITAKGLEFQYVLKKGKYGNFNNELIVNRKNNSKTLTKSSIILAYKKAMDMKGEIITGPKSLGQIFGVSYIYSILFAFALIDVPQNIRKRMLRK